MRRRFAEAPRTTLEIGREEIEVVVAERPLLRFLGLMGVDEEEMPALLFPRCRSLHTFWMRSAIDLVWIDLDRGRVLGVEQVPRRRTVRGPRGATAALELPPGQADRLGIKSGGRVSVRPAPEFLGFGRRARHVDADTDELPFSSEV